MARPIGLRMICRYAAQFRATAARLDRFGTAAVRRRGAATPKA